MRDLMEMNYEILQRTSGELQHRREFTEEFIKELVKEGSAEIAPHLTCKFNLIKMEYQVTLSFPVSLNKPNTFKSNVE